MSYGTNAPFGLQPRQYLDGSLWTGQQSEYYIDTTNYAARYIYTGDPVQLTAGGGITSFVFNANGSINLDGFNDAGASIGAFFGCKYYDTSRTLQFSPYWGNFNIAPNTNVIAYITDDPNILYDIQVSSDTSASTNIAALKLGILAADLNGNYQLGMGSAAFTNNATNVPNNPTSGSTISGQSAIYLDTVNADPTVATLQLKIIRLTPRPGNVFYAASPGVGSGNFNNVLVLINNHAYKGGTGTAGV